MPSRRWAVLITRNHKITIVSKHWTYRGALRYAEYLTVLHRAVGARGAIDVVRLP